MTGLRRMTIGRRDEWRRAWVWLLVGLLAAGLWSWSEGAAVARRPALLGHGWALLAVGGYLTSRLVTRGRPVTPVPRGVPRWSTWPVWPYALACAVLLLLIDLPSLPPDLAVLLVPAEPSLLVAGALLVLWECLARLYRRALLAAQIEIVVLQERVNRLEARDGPLSFGDEAVIRHLDRVRRQSAGLEV